MKQTMAMSKSIFPILACVVLTTLGAERLIWKADFESPQGLAAWQFHTKNGRSTYALKDGCLEVGITGHFYDDGYIEADIPLCRSGYLEFEAQVNQPGVSNPGPSLFLEFYNISTFWHDYCKDWRCYVPAPEQRREPGFAMEAPGHAQIARIFPGQWVRYRIQFDAKTDHVEFLAGNARDPSLILGTHPVLGRDEYLGGRIRIGSMGHTSPYVCRIRNLKLFEYDEKSEKEGKTRDLILLFNGFSSNLYGLHRILPQEKLRTYTLVSTRAAASPINRWKYDLLPGRVSLEQAAVIILADAPAEPAGILPEFLQKDIERAVADGARLVLLGGPCALNRGGLGGSWLWKRLLPLNEGAVKDMHTFPEPMPIQGNFISGTEKPPKVLTVHALTPRENADTLLSAGGRPVLVSAPFGKGTVRVFLGTPLGQAEGIFHKSTFWPELAKYIIQ